MSLAAVLGLVGPVARSGTLTDSAACADSTRIVFRWTFDDDPLNPVTRPDWFGWDLMRRTVADCGPFLRVDAPTFVHTPGARESFEFSEAPPAPRALLEYRVVPVNAARLFLPLSPAECDGCAAPAFVTCPELSAPLVTGTVMDLGWAVMLMPCAGACYSTFYVENPRAAELRPFAGTSTVVSVWGGAACGTVEGCALTLDRFAVTSCEGFVRAPGITWGRLKTHYR